MQYLAQVLILVALLGHGPWSFTMAQMSNSTNATTVYTATTLGNNETINNSSVTTSPANTGSSGGNSTDSNLSGSNTTVTNSESSTESNLNSSNVTGTVVGNSTDSNLNTSNGTVGNSTDSNSMNSNGTMDSGNGTSSNGSESNGGSSGLDDEGIVCFKDTMLNTSTNNCNFTTMGSSETSRAINKRCRAQLLSGESMNSTRGHFVMDGAVCGVLNATTVESANSSALCYSSMNNTFHHVRLSVAMNASMDENEFKAMVVEKFNEEMLASSLGFTDLGLLESLPINNSTLDLSMMVRFHNASSVNESIYESLGYSPTIKSVSVLEHCANVTTPAPPTTTPSPEENPGTTAATREISVVPPTSKSKKPCFFVSIKYSTEINTIINTKCREVFSYKTQSYLGMEKIGVTNKRCGLEKAKTVEEAQESPLCYSFIDNRIKHNVIHRLRIRELLYLPEFSQIRKRPFRSHKNQIEESYNSLALSSPKLLGMGFDRAILLTLERPKRRTSSRRKRDLNQGVDASLVVQFTKTPVDITEYISNFNRKTLKGSLLGEYALDAATNKMEDAKICNESLSTLIKTLDPDILRASGITNISGRAEVSMGDSLDLRCPSGKKFSVDEDGFVKNDGILQLLCMSHLRFKVPVPSWPKCVKFCPLKLPKAPSHTGLSPVLPVFNVPAGQNGKYMCTKNGLGVDRGQSPYYEVQCLNNTFYRLPSQKYDWPVCEEKSTTITPEIPIGVNNMLDRYTWNINYRHTRYQSDSDFIPRELKDYFSSITIPCFIGLLLGILFCLCFTRNDSPICNICRDTTLKKKKTLIPYRESESI